MKNESRFPGPRQSLHAKLSPAVLLSWSQRHGGREMTGIWGQVQARMPGILSPEITLKHLILFLIKYKSEKYI